MATFLITGTARGLGLELTKQLSALPATEVSKIFAVTRSKPSTPLKELINSSDGRIVNIIAPVDDTKSVEKAAQDVQAHLGASQGLDVLINNAAIQWTSSNGKTEGYKPEDLAQVLDTNVVGPQRFIVNFLPLLQAGKEKKVINISSTMGSITLADELHLAPGQAYKVSKAALHMLNKQYAMDHANEGYTFLCVSPGHLKTDLGGAGDFTADIGAAEVRRIIQESTTAQTGKFLNIHVPGWEDAFGKYDGKEVPW